MGRTARIQPQNLYSTAITVLALTAVQTLQIFSACTVQLYLYSPMVRTVFTVSQCLYSTAITLLTLWAERALQILSACKVHLYIYYPYGS